jgi:dTDP-glucose 4,6-dehydratase
VYGDGNQIREWIYVNDNVDAILSVITKGKPGEIYNITSSHEMSNIDVVNKIRDILQNANNSIEVRIEHVEDRPGHDRRYSLNSSKLKKDLRWNPSFSFASALEQTVRWYINNDWWWIPLLKDNVPDYHPWKIDWQGKGV